MDRKAHWEKVYRTKQPTEVSWYQPQPTLSLNLLAEANVGPAAAISWNIALWGYLIFTDLRNCTKEGLAGRQKPIFESATFSYMVSIQVSIGVDK